MIHHYEIIHQHLITNDSYQPINSINHSLGGDSLLTNDSIVKKKGLPPVDVKIGIQGSQQCWDAPAQLEPPAVGPPAQRR